MVNRDPQKPPEGLPYVAGLSALEETGVVYDITMMSHYISDTARGLDDPQIIHTRHIPVLKVHIYVT